jgi:ATP-dependent DNA ligase
VCELDLEGIVAKHGASVYQDRPSRDMWIKIKNPNYSQKEGRHEWFDRLRKKAKARAVAEGSITAQRLGC